MALVCGGTVSGSNLSGRPAERHLSPRSDRSDPDWLWRAGAPTRGAISGRLQRLFHSIIIHYETAADVHHQLCGNPEAQPPIGLH